MKNVKIEEAIKNSVPFMLDELNKIRGYSKDVRDHEGDIIAEGIYELTDKKIKNLEYALAGLLEMANGEKELENER